MSMSAGGSQGGLNSTINVTPLVDVMLVLLIIMMLIAPLLQQGHVRLPEAGNTVDKPDNSQQTIVSVGSADQLWVNGLPVSKSEFTDKVALVLADKTEKVVLIKGDQDAHYSAIMEAMDSLRRAEIEDIGLITEKKLTKTSAGGK